MKKRGRFIFLLTLVSIILVVMAVILILHFETKSMDLNRKEIITSSESQSEDDADSEYEDVEDYNEEETSAIATSNTKINGDFDEFIFVGDSRYKGMEFLAGDQDTFITESGRGYDFLLEQYATIKSLCDTNSQAGEKTAVIIGLGVNDNLTSAAENYITELKQLEDEVDAQIYYMLVNPVDEDIESYSGYNVTNENIDLFNSQMVANLDSGIGIIDTNSYLKTTGFETKDGLHYLDDTYRLIYDYIKYCIKGDQ